MSFLVYSNHLLNSRISGTDTHECRGVLRHTKTGFIAIVDCGFEGFIVGASYSAWIHRAVLLATRRTQAPFQSASSFFVRSGLFQSCSVLFPSAHACIYRSQVPKDHIVAQCKALHPAGEYTFVKADESLKRAVLPSQDLANANCDWARSSETS